MNSILQRLTYEWLRVCFPDTVAEHLPERGTRHLEEATEVAQACGVDRAMAHRIVDYVFDRPVGELVQEIGGSALTLAALAAVAGTDIEACWGTELERVIGMTEKIREKQRFKASRGIVAIASPALEPMERTA